MPLVTTEPENVRKCLEMSEYGQKKVRIWTFFCLKLVLFYLVVCGNFGKLSDAIVG